jgi:predicted RNase H-like HicB family nuclease
MTGYAVIIEGEGDSYSAYVPELPGCVAAGKSVAEVEKLIREAIEFHIEGMREAGEPVPAPTSSATTIIESPSLS